MDEQSKKRKKYQQHRENQRGRILEAAEHIFIRDGIEHVSLSDIAEVARITRMTLYEYYPNKQAIAWAVFQKFMEDLQTSFSDERQPPGKNGFQRIERAMLASLDLLEQHPEHLRFLVEFNSLYAREGDPVRLRQVVEHVWPENYDMFARMIQQGIADGSLRPDLNPGLLSAAILNLLNGMNSRFALLGHLIGDEYGQPVKDIYREICRTFLRGIQSPGSSEEKTQ
jgi:AcrR family transcriptional regulator